MRIPNPVSSARELVSIVREISLDELQEAALRVPQIAVVSTTRDEAQSEALRILGTEARSHVVTLGEDDAWPDRADVVLVDRRARPRRVGRYVPVVEFLSEEAADRIHERLVRIGDERELALGRYFPELRASAAMYVVNATSRANAQFALASNIPALVPIVGGILSAGADTIVLTKNQLMMIYKLAAIHDRDLDNRFRIYREMAPVVGAGLAWRTVARELAAMVPFAAGAIPKVVIAYTGTYVAGMAAHVYYQEGRKVSGERMRGFYNQALEQLKALPGLNALPLPDRSRNGPSRPVVIDADYRPSESSRMP